jgi:peptidase M28-like protein/ER metallopeptidase-like protein
MTPSPPDRVIPEFAAARSPAWRGWAVWAVFYAAIAVSLCRPWHDTRVPPAAAIADHEFSAERAFTHVDALANKLGRRLAGTAACAQAADYIEAELRRLGVETARQVSSGSFEFRGATVVYRGVTNLLARIPGKRPEAILVSAHYDSAAEGPGAGDNALAVAAGLEIVRALRGTGPLENTVLFNFNGGEELGLLGAAAFVHHPWFADVVRFINLDASGGQGRQLLLRSSPGSEDLVEAYAASAPHVHGTVLAQEIFRLLPFDTDYRVYQDAGLAGLDLAPYGDNYAYHSALDRADRVSRRTLQDSGENVLAILRGLPAQDRRGSAAGAPAATYYDLLGLVMVRYPAGTARVIGLLVAALALILACRPDRRARRPVAMLALGVGSVALSTLLALAAPAAFAVVLTLAGKVMSWYARPWIAVVVYGSFTLAGVLAAQVVVRRFARRRGLAEADVIAAGRRGLVVCWAALLVLTTSLGTGAAYLPLWWCFGATVAMLGSGLRGSLRLTVTLAGFAMAALTTAQAAQLLLTSLVPLSGALGPGAPVEVVLAAVTAVVLAPFAVVLAPLIQASPLRRVAAGVAPSVLVAIGLVAFSFPYTVERPKRMYVEVHTNGQTAPRPVFEFIDPGPRPEVTTVPIERRRSEHMPAIEVAPSASRPAGSSAVDVQLVATGAYLVDVYLEGDSSSWSLATGTDGARHVIWVGTAEPLRFRVDRTPGAPVRVRIKAYYLGSEVALDQVREQLPSWALPDVQTVRETDAAL